MNFVVVHNVRNLREGENVLFYKTIYRQKKHKGIALDTVIWEGFVLNLPGVKILH